jgi:tetratricopeptide (TPR) repeat protein
MRTVTYALPLLLLILPAGCSTGGSPVTTMAQPADLDALWDYDDPVGTEVRFREILPAAEASGDRAYEAELLTQIARTEALQRRFDEAHATLDQAYGLITDDMGRPAVRYLLERGRTFNSAGKLDEARPLFKQAWTLAREHHEDGLAVDAAHMLGIIETGEEGLGWNRVALELAEESPDPDAQRWKASLCNNMGWTYFSLDQYEAALDQFEAALRYRQEQGKPKDIRVARWCVARCLRALGRIEEALAIQRELETELEQAGTRDGYVQEEIAECLLALGRDAEARPSFRRAHDLLSQDLWLLESEPDRIARLRQLAAEPIP